MLSLAQRLLAASLLLHPAARGQTTPAPIAPPANYQQMLDIERERRANGLMAPEGWLSLVALQWLKPGDTTVGSAPDNMLVLAHAPAHMLRLRMTEAPAGSSVMLAAADGTVMLDGAPARAGAALAAEGPHASELRAGSLVATVIERGDRLYLRVKDANAPTRVHFHGLRWYPVTPGLRVTARWIPATGEHTLAIPNVLGQISHEASPGVAEFTLDGKTIRLEPLVEDNDTLFFIFRDSTSRSETYGAGRFLYTDAPSNGLSRPGTVVLDFNRAQNPPCAYTAFATCPLPPADNRLSVAIPAGEKRYHE